jgi:heptosyltransferase I
VVIDAQGLLKSALIAKCANTTVIKGFNSTSAREPIASFFYQARFDVNKSQHAVERTRQLFGQAFGYTPAPTLNFGINQNFAQVAKNPRKLMFIIGTSWVTKLWSAFHWQRLTAIALEEGYEVEIMWGSSEERALADSIIAACPTATRPLQRMTITAIAEKLVEAAGVIGLDTGFSHLAGALETPTIALYGATSPVKVGLIGAHTSNLHLEELLACMPCHKRHCKWLPENSHDTPPCMNGIKPFDVWRTLTSKLAP